MSKKEYVVYYHNNKINNKKYIGISCEYQRRWRSNGIGYLGCSAFYNAIQKYGWQNFEHIILEENLTKQQAEEREKFYIKYYNTTDKKYGYNISLGGSSPTAGRSRSEETKQKISEANRGRIFSEEHRKKLSEAHKGKPSPNKGKTFSEEYRKKLSESHKGENHPKSKAVMCIETGEIYVNGPEAAEQLGKDRKVGGSTITRCARGQRKTAYGYHWKYIDQG